MLLLGPRGRTFKMKFFREKKNKHKSVSKKKPHHKLSHRTRWHEGDIRDWTIGTSSLVRWHNFLHFFFLWNLSTKHKTCFWPLQTANAIKQNWHSYTSLSDFAFWFILEQLMCLFGNSTMKEELHKQILGIILLEAFQNTKITEVRPKKLVFTDWRCPWNLFLLLAPSLISTGTKYLDWLIQLFIYVFGLCCFL